MQNIKDSNLVWVKVLYPNKKPYSPPGILSSLLHDTPDVRDGLEWMDCTGLDYELGDLGVDRICVCIAGTSFFRVGINLPA